MENQTPPPDDAAIPAPGPERREFLKSAALAVGALALAACRPDRLAGTAFSDVHADLSKGDQNDDRIQPSLSTRLTRDYGIEVPFVGAGMGFIAVPALVAAVSNAG
ncbi:MAG: twin-arginine translocation signal domain-containing protein, partial [bacterium]